MGMASEDLTARIRALYETTSVPVREIAVLAGVTERTLYTYVNKHGWTKRYRVLPRGLAAAAANRGRRWQHAADVAPAQRAAQAWRGDAWRRPKLPPRVPDNPRVEQALVLAERTAFALLDALYRDDASSPSP